MAEPQQTPADEEALRGAMGRTIALARADAGFPTQTSFAERLEARVQWMSRVERGEENLTLQTLARITAVLGVPMPDFLARVADELRSPTTARGRGRRKAAAD